MAADMDARNPDIYFHMKYLGKGAISIQDYVPEFQGTSPYDPKSVDSFMVHLDKELRSGPENLVVVVNTASNGLDSLEPFRDVYFPANGQYYDQETEVFGVYLRSPADSEGYKMAMRVMGDLGKEHLITVQPEHASAIQLDPDGGDQKALVNQRVTQVTSMRQFRPNIFMTQIAPDTASFGLDIPAVRDMSWQIAYAWWSQHVADIVNLFGFTEPASNDARKQAAVTEDA